jgi:hypothetical protein
LNQKMPNKMTLLPIVLKRKVYRDLWLVFSVLAIFLPIMNTNHKSR